jgi:hypothetical protein
MKHKWNFKHKDKDKETVNKTISSRQTKFETRSFTTYRIGKNILSARLSILSNKIPLDWLNLGKDSFKVKCKGLFF